MPTPLTNTQINDICLNIFDSSYGGAYAFCRPCFEIMYSTGLRVNEVLEAYRWVYLSPQVYKVETEKGSYNRVIDFGALGINVDDWYNRGWENYFYKSPTPYVNAILKYTNYQRLMLGAKPVKTHLFRYNIAKLLFESSGNIVDVQTYLGLVNADVAFRYVEAEIYED